MTDVAGTGVEAKRVVSAHDLYELQTVTNLDLSPDGQQIVFSQQRVDRESEKKYSNMWLAGTENGRIRQFTYGDQVDGSPYWSPDGSQIAFLSNREDENQTQIYLIPTDGGEARRLTDLKGSIASFSWSPDGTELILQFRRKDEAEIEREEDEQKKNLGVVARHITRLSYKRDAVGFLPEERWHIWVVDTQSGCAEQVTSGEVHDEVMPNWSPDGSEIIYVSNGTDDPDRNPLNDELFVVPRSGGEPRQLETFSGRKAGPVFSPDGQWIAFTGSEGLDQFWRKMDIWIVPVDGSGPARNLTGHHNHAAGALTLSDTANFKLETEPVWSMDGKRIYFLMSHHGHTGLYSIAVEGEENDLVPEVDQAGAMGNFSFDRDREHVAYMHATWVEPGQIWLRDVAGDGIRQITRINKELLSELQFGQRDEIWIDGPETRLQGWIMMPPDFDETNDYPAILEIHGGPMLQYGDSFMHEFHLLTAQGYIVFFTNPRGSHGYGDEFVDAIRHNFGGVAHDDLMAWTNHVAGLPYVDADRMGVTGGSYGGYMTNWIIGHTDRFKAAVTQRSLSNLVSFNGSSDIWIFEYLFGKRRTWQSVKDYWKQSPIAYIDDVVTPTLILHSEQDLRVSVEQGEQLFVFLKLKGVETEMVRFPDESHGLSRAGRTDRRVVRLEHMLRWFDRYLK